MWGCGGLWQDVEESQEEKINNEWVEFRKVKIE
jgi:hypothetical protein